MLVLGWLAGLRVCLGEPPAPAETIPARPSQPIYTTASGERRVVSQTLWTFAARATIGVRRQTVGSRSSLPQLRARCRAPWCCGTELLLWTVAARTTIGVGDQRSGAEAPSYSLVLPGRAIARSISFKRWGSDAVTAPPVRPDGRRPDWVSLFRQRAAGRGFASAIQIGTR